MIYFKKYSSYFKENAIIGYFIFGIYYFLLRNISALMEKSFSDIKCHEKCNFLTGNKPEHIHLYSNFWAMFLIIILVSGPNRFTCIFKTRILKNAGKYSYGTYLLHPYALSIVMNSYHKYNSELIRIGYTLLIAYWFGKCFYYLIEFPLSKVSNHFCMLATSRINNEEEKHAI